MPQPTVGHEQVALVSTVRITVTLALSGTQAPTVVRHRDGRVPVSQAAAFFQVQVVFKLSTSYYYRDAIRVLP